LNPSSGLKIAPAEIALGATEEDLDVAIGHRFERQEEGPIIFLN
jgi:hypothetical protein